MIAALRGDILVKSPVTLILDVNGVGYDVHISTRTHDALPSVGEELFLFIHTSVREDAITLFGFTEEREKEVFLLLLSVSGIGPKLALAILSGIGVHELSDAVSLKDIPRLTAISGVGKKTAQRLCVELGDKVGSFSNAGKESDSVVAQPVITEGFALQDAVSALTNLGYPQQMAWQALRAVQKQNPEEVSTLKVEELIRRALQVLA